MCLGCSSCMCRCLVSSGASEVGLCCRRVAPQHQFASNSYAQIDDDSAFPGIFGRPSGVPQ